MAPETGADGWEGVYETGRAIQYCFCVKESSSLAFTTSIPHLQEIRPRKGTCVVQIPRNYDGGLAGMARW